MQPENFRLKMSIKLRRNWKGVKINNSKKIDENTMIIDTIAETNKWCSVNSLRDAIKLSIEAVTKDRKVIAKIHNKGFIINKNTQEERIILPILFINQEEE